MSIAFCLPVELPCFRKAMQIWQKRWYLLLGIAHCEYCILSACGIALFSGRRCKFDNQWGKQELDWPRRARDKQTLCAWRSTPEIARWNHVSSCLQFESWNRNPRISVSLYIPIYVEVQNAWATNLYSCKNLLIQVGLKMCTPICFLFFVRTSDFIVVL